MITTNNYFEKVANIDFDKLPAALKNGDKLTKGAAPNNWSAYNSNDNIKRVVDAYMQKLEEYLEKNPPEKPKAEKKEEAKAETKVKPKEKKQKQERKPNYKGLKVEIRPASKSSSKFIVWDIKTDQKFANESFDSINEAKKFIKDNGMILVQSKKHSEESNATPIEKIDIEVQFIKRYVMMNGKVKTQDEILRFLNSLQKAILEKRIRKTSPYAAEIEHIQGQLIKCYEKMGESIEITIDKKTVEKYTAISGSQKAMLSVAYIKQYISLHGKKNVKEKAQVLMAKMKKAVEKSKIDKEDPYAERLNKLYNSLNEYIEGKTTVPVISKSELNGLMGLVGYSQKKSPELNGIDEEPGNPEVIRSTDLAGMEFKTIGLQGKYRELIGDPCVGFSAMVYGLPKSGKSTLCIDFAKYLAQNHGKVLYCAIEEKFGYTLKEKIERLQATHPNLYVSETVPENLSDYDFVFIDSVSRGNFDLEYLRQLRQDNPKTSFIFIYHTTKEGNFRGKNENAHEVDVIIEVAGGKAKGNGRFGMGRECLVF